MPRILLEWGFPFSEYLFVLTRTALTWMIFSRTSTWMPQMMMTTTTTMMMRTVLGFSKQCFWAVTGDLLS